jgi:hypothetical protein
MGGMRREKGGGRRDAEGMGLRKIVLLLVLVLFLFLSFKPSFERRGGNGSGRERTEERTSKR